MPAHPLTSDFPTGHSRPSQSLHLTMIHGPGYEQTIPLDTFPILIGRDVLCQVRLNDAQVSRHHCRIERADGQIIVRDLNSRNGTLVNSRKVSGTFPLAVGDTLIVGRTGLQLQDTTSSPPRADQPATAIFSAADSHTLTGREHKP